MNMVKVLSFSFEQCFGRLPCYLSKGSLKPDFLDIYLTTIFEVRKFKNTSAMRVIFFLKMFKIQSKLPKWKKQWEKVCSFFDNCIWRCCKKLSLLRREYFSSPVSGLIKNPEILNITKRDFFRLNIFHSDE